MRGYTYDAGMLIAADRGQRHAWALHRRALQTGTTVSVPAGVLAQVWRGGPQPLFSRLLQACAVDPLNEAAARAAGAACALARTADIVDASVVVAALSRGDTVVTADPADIVRLSEGIGQRVPVRPI